MKTTNKGAVAAVAVAGGEIREVSRRTCPQRGRLRGGDGGRVARARRARGGEHRKQGKGSAVHVFFKKLSRC